MLPDHADTWDRIRAELRQAVAPDVFDVWLARLELVALDGTELVVEAPRELRAWVAERFARVLQASAAAVLGPDAAVRVRAGGGGPAPVQRRGGPAGDGDDEPDEDRPAGDPADRVERLNPKYTFEQFVIGDANRFAHAAALAVAELPGHAYNPLFVYGPPGVGKTHLLHAIGNYVSAYGTGLTVRATTAEAFTNAFLAAVRGRDMPRFKGRYRANDVLLIDDVQFLAQKARTMEEFFHTFNALYETGAQIVVTSDRTPDDLDELDERLRARFQAGLVTAVQPPDRATRLAVLHKRVHNDGVVLRDGAALERIADRVPHNVRALEGALIRVVAFSSLTGRPIDAPLADEVLDDLYPRRAPRPGVAPARGADGAPASRDGGAPMSIERVQDAIAEAFGITREELLSHSRAARLVWPRQLAMYLAREHTGATLPAIGRRFGGRNHTTVMHACRRAAERLQSDADAQACAQRVLAALGTDRPG